MSSEHRTCKNCGTLIEWKPGEPKRDFLARKYCDRDCWSEGKRRDWRPRFWAKVERRGPDECWTWKAAFHNGYGAFMKDGRTQRAHSVVAKDVLGPGKPGHEVRHLCGHRSCVNPAHLEWGTRTENMRDLVLHGNSVAKLDPEKVRAIRRMLGRRTHRQIADQFKVSTATVSDICYGRSWGWLDD